VYYEWMKVCGDIVSMNGWTAILKHDESARYHTRAIPAKLPSVCITMIVWATAPQPGTPKTV